MTVAKKQHHPNGLSQEQVNAEVKRLWKEIKELQLQKQNIDKRINTLSGEIAWLTNSPPF